LTWRENVASRADSISSGTATSVANADGLGRPPAPRSLLMPEPSSQREFWAAVGGGNLARVRELVAAGADVNLPISTPGGETPLIRAIGAGDLAMVGLLLEVGADVNQRWNGPKSWTPLMFAHDNPEMLEVLIAAGADVDSQATADSIR